MDPREEFSDQIDNPLLKYLEKMNDPMRKDPQRLDPRARWSKDTAQAALLAMGYYRSKARRGEATLPIDMRELDRAARICTIILRSETEQTIDDFDGDPSSGDRT